MAEQTETGGTEAAQAPARPQMRVLAQYVRDMSFENFAMQKGLKIEGQPQVQVQVALDAKKMTENRFEVIMKVKVENKTGDDMVFLLELDYAGQFQIDNVPAQQMHPYLLIECPRMLFPYVRRIVGDVTRDGGFPPLNIDNIDFLALYQQDMARRQQAAQADAAAAPKN